MWHLNRKKDKQEYKDKAEKMAAKMAVQFVRLRKMLVRRLERLDASLNMAQRKAVFYTGILIWSSCMFYILGNAIRKQPASFVLPVDDAADIKDRIQSDSVLNKHGGKIIHQHKKLINGKK